MINYSNLTKILMETVQGGRWVLWIWQMSSQLTLWVTVPASTSREQEYLNPKLANCT
jgi:hypothetical protein